MCRLLAERCYSVLFASILVTVFSLQGCATVTRGTTEALVVETNPPGAKVTVMKMDKLKYKIPESIELKDVGEDEEVYGRHIYIVNPEFEKLEAPTPTSFKLARRGQYKVIVEKDGYEVAKVMVHAQVTDAGSAGLAGNLCLGGCIGASVDLASGAMNKLVPNPINIELVALKEQSEFETFEAKKFSIPKSEFSDEVYALVIGISKYKYAKKRGLANLVYADDDARAIAKSLGDLGWSDSRIRILINEEATKRNIEIALESWLSKAREGKMIVIFWSGHGFPDPEDPEKVYFACYDTIINIPATGYRMDRVRSILEEHRARNVIVLADTCHAGKLITRGERAISIVPQIEKMRREQSIPRGWVFMVGADSDRLAIENSSWTNGAFTHCLVEALSGKADGFESVGPKDGTVTMREVRAYLNSRMPDETQRVLGVAKRPVITTSTGDPNIWNLSLDRRPAEKHNRLKSEPARFEVEKQLFEKEEDLGENERQRLDNEKQKLAYVPKTVLTPPVSLRSDPKFLLEKHIKKMLKKHNFYDRDLNKHGSFSNDFVDNGDGTITDRATGLMWQKSGSSRTKKWKRAQTYVKQLNKGFAGYSDWRLPTIDELASLVEREKVNGVHIDPVFDSKQKTCWSADYNPTSTIRVSGYEGWIVKFAEGTIIQTMWSLGRYHGYGNTSWYIRVVRSVK